MTQECFIYKIDPKFQLIGKKDLFIIDTPGLDTDDAIHLVLDKLDDFI